ncbi:MAG TPA: NADP-dependent isocitrate dehydrogenase, partial [Burkholderiaceae bacterium]|nr:NADP-dependent isocitrate dehydrogenase [Burkholderiaceae bacterium]
TDNEQKILGEFADVQGAPADIGGYYLADRVKVTAIMRPSATFNAAIDGMPA